MARQPGLHHELVLIDQSQLRQRQRELHASHEQSLTGASAGYQTFDGPPFGTFPTDDVERDACPV